MFSLLINWYKNLSPARKLLISFIANWIVWFISWLVIKEFLLDEKHSISYYIFYATWMAFFGMLLSDWKNIKLVFGKQKQA